MIYTISSKQNEKIKDILKLAKPSERNARKQFIVEGYHLLEMALENKCVLSIFTIKEIKGIDKSIPQYLISEDILSKISSTKSPQGVKTTLVIAIFIVSEFMNYY